MKKQVALAFLLLVSVISFAQKGKVYPSSNPLPRLNEGILQNYIRKHVVYPEQAKQQKLEGRVVVSFIVETDGKVSNVKVLKTTNLVFNEAALSCIKSLPVFKPGLINGSPVRVQMYEAVPFSLKPLPEVKEAQPPMDTEEEMAAAEVDMVQAEVDLIQGDPNGADDAMIAPPSEEPKPLSEEILVFAEQMPEFPGDLNAYLSKNLIYPSDAKENGIQGKVIVQFTIGSDGNIYDVKALRPTYPSLDKEAMRVVKSMPKWKPGKQNGKAVAVRYTLPITFSLK